MSLLKRLFGTSNSEEEQDVEWVERQYSKRFGEYQQKIVYKDGSSEKVWAKLKSNNGEYRLVKWPDRFRANIHSFNGVDVSRWGGYTIKNIPMSSVKYVTECDKRLVKATGTYEQKKIDGSFVNSYRNVQEEPDVEVVDE